MAMEMRGSLNLSKYYKPGSNQPKFYGKALVDGKEYVIKGWEKVRQDTGEVWTSLLFESTQPEDDFTSPELRKPAQPAPTPAPVPARKTRAAPVYPDWSDDDIPF